MHVRVDFYGNSDLVVVLSVDQGDKCRQLSSGLPLLALEEICQLDHTHHLAGSVAELSQHDALILELIPVVVILLSAHAPELPFLFVLDIVVRDVSIGEEILDLKGV
jgi:hypothetical protein